MPSVEPSGIHVEVFLIERSFLCINRLHTPTFFATNSCIGADNLQGKQ